MSSHVKGSLVLEEPDFISRPGPDSHKQETLKRAGDYMLNHIFACFFEYLCDIFCLSVQHECLLVGVAQE